MAEDCVGQRSAAAFMLHRGVWRLPADHQQLRTRFASGDRRTSPLEPLDCASSEFHNPAVFSCEGHTDMPSQSSVHAHFLAAAGRGGGATLSAYEHRQYHDGFEFQQPSGNSAEHTTHQYQPALVLSLSTPGRPFVDVPPFSNCLDWSDTASSSVCTSNGLSARESHRDDILQLASARSARPRGAYHCAPVRSHAYSTWTTALGIVQQRRFFQSRSVFLVRPEVDAPTLRTGDSVQEAFTTHLARCARHEAAVKWRTSSRAASAENLAVFDGLLVLWARGAARARQYARWLQQRDPFKHRAPDDAADAPLSRRAALALRNIYMCAAVRRAWGADVAARLTASALATSSQHKPSVLFAPDEWESTLAEVVHHKGQRE